LQQIKLSDVRDRALMRIETFEPVSENPVFTLQQKTAGRVKASGRDNNGNDFSVWIAP
jgi:sulfur-oxidizing protein SoxY